jgi:hypothetical protein
METKVCKNCNIDLPITDYYKKGKNGLYYICKKCKSEKNKTYMEKYLSNPVNREKIRENKRKNEKKKALENRLIKQKLKEDALILLNIEKEKKSQELERKRLAKEERNRMIAYKKTDEYKVEQKNKDNARRYERWKNKFKNDPLFALKKRLRTLIRGSFRKSGYTNFAMKTESIVGISYNEFKIYMESKFVNGMSWDNRLEWHIDHIIPLSSAKSEDELIALSHYTNLQPLWAMDNLKKGARVDMV